MTYHQAINYLTTYYEAQAYGANAYREALDAIKQHVADLEAAMPDPDEMEELAIELDNAGYSITRDKVQVWAKAIREVK